MELNFDLAIYIIYCGIENGSTKLKTMDFNCLDYHNGQGRYDVCCPMMSAWDLHKAWPEADLKVSYTLFSKFSSRSFLSLFLHVVRNC